MPFCGVFTTRINRAKASVLVPRKHRVGERGTKHDQKWNDPHSSHDSVGVQVKLSSGKIVTRANRNKVCCVLLNLMEQIFKCGEKTTI